MSAPATPGAIAVRLAELARATPENVSITGDLHVIQTLKNIFTSIDIDWEEKLSHYIGDVAAHIFCQKWRKLCEYQHYAIKSFTRSSREYLQEEMRCFPTRAELTDFFDDIRS
jgi:ubiquinone biosynthesis protein UbiJ